MLAWCYDFIWENSVKLFCTIKDQRSNHYAWDYFINDYDVLVIWRYVFVIVWDFIVKWCDRVIVMIACCCNVMIFILWSVMNHSCICTLFTRILSQSKCLFLLPMVLWCFYKILLLCLFQVNILQKKALSVSSFREQINLISLQKFVVVFIQFFILFICCKNCGEKAL